MDLRRLGELGLIRRIREAGRGRSAPGVLTGIGDDTAVLSLAPGASLLATTDLVIEGVHFRRATASARDVGWKALAVNLSDIAAMGGVPRYALVALAVPGSAATEELDDFYDGMRAAAASHAVTIVGGDTAESPDGWFVNVTVLGEHPGTPRLRSAAKPGDAVAVTGSVGRSAGGLALLEMGPAKARAAGIAESAIEMLTAAHLRPTARVSEGGWRGQAAGTHAMMDLSDGLATDLGHICRESGVGARVRIDRLPIAPAVREVAEALGRNAVEWAIAGGEDYELLVTCSPDVAEELARGLREATGTPLTVVGEIEAGRGEPIWLGSDGEPITVRAGYEHFSG